MRLALEEIFINPVRYNSVLLESGAEGLEVMLNLAGVEKIPESRIVVEKVKTLHDLSVVFNDPDVSIFYKEKYLKFVLYEIAQEKEEQGLFIFLFKYV